MHLYVMCSEPHPNPRYDVAAALHMKDDNPVLLKILNELEPTDAWDPSSIISRVYVKQGVKIFKLGGLEKFMEVTSEEKLKESFSVSSAGLSKDGLLSSSSSSDGLKIKIESLVLHSCNRVSPCSWLRTSNQTTCSTM